MQPYEGGKPYIFISYSHSDADKVNYYINYLQQKMCYVWYDKGNNAGDDWAEVIANHLVKSYCVLLFISSHSVQSVNVNNELTMALNYKKRVIPVYIDDVRLPLGWEIKISHLHAIRLEKDCDVLLREIPREVFRKTEAPFYKNDRHSFYFLSEELRDGFEGKLSIVCETDGERKTLWTHQSQGPFELCAIVNENEKDENGVHPVLVNMQCQAKDDFFDMKGNGCIIFSVRVVILLPYPLNGPEGDGIIIFALVDPLGAEPKIRVLDSMISVAPYSYGGKDYPGYAYDPYDPPAIEYDRILKMLPKE
ncbi:MAG TPA: toll/interleukin-1 receptor domain-containing protein [Candidatus Faecicola pullistercoris]|nr:toll/interleukin-1 receptor domain-containing protein [Candidatus Faecicola pullistercoris]